MFFRLRRFLDVRAGEGLPVLLSFFYVACVVAAFLLAKPLRNSLYLSVYGPYALAYAYAAVPLVLSIFVPVYSAIGARVGTRAATSGTLLFFSLNVLAFWWAFRAYPFELLPGVFYVWVNCFGVIAPVQAWSFANSLFDARQAKRLFGLIGAGASFGAIAGGVMARYLVAPVGGTVNLLLVLAGLILTAALIVALASRRLKKRPFPRRRRRKAATALVETFAMISASPYLRLLAALVVLVAIVTQWTAFQLSLVATGRFGGNADALTRFFGTFNFLLGAVGFTVQLLLTARLIRRFGVGSVVLFLPLALTFGSSLTLLFPVFAAVLLTNAFDQSLRFSVDKAAYELLYLPIPPIDRQTVKNALDIIANRFADAVGGVVLGVMTGGFFMLPGAGFGVRGMAAATLVLALTWVLVAWRLRRAYVSAIGESIHRYRVDTERANAIQADEPGDELVAAQLASNNVEEVRDALGSLVRTRSPRPYPELHALLAHEASDIRRDALAVLADSGDRTARETAEALLTDPDPQVRTQALLYLARDGGVDPLRRLQELRDVEDFSIRAGMVAFLSAPGPARNEDAARVLLTQMAGGEDPRERAEAARLAPLLDHPPLRIVADLIEDPDEEVSRQAVRSAEALRKVELLDPLLMVLSRPALVDDAVSAIAALGDPVVPLLEAALLDPLLSLEIRREVPVVLVRIATPAAQGALVSALLDADAPLRHRVVASLNKVKLRHPDAALDRVAIELLLAAEIAGHYRSYQVLVRLADEAGVAAALRHTMDQELERIFRLIALLSRRAALHDAYVGVRSPDSLIRANALEYLEHVLKPELRSVLLPLIDNQVSELERAQRADQLLGTSIETSEEAIATLLASTDPWLRSRVEIAANRIAEQPGPDTEHTPAPVSMHSSVGAG